MRVWAKIPDEGLHIACGTLSFAAAFARQLERQSGGRDALAKRLAAMPDRARAARQAAIIADGFTVPFVRDAVILHDRFLADMETRLAGHDLLAGTDYSLAEACLLPYVERLKRLGLAPMWDRRPGLARWYARASARPSYAAEIAGRPPTDYGDRLEGTEESAWPAVRAILASR
ncbi:MAG: hypothetical protein FJX67_14385 [Alphaproteobacteria bacterium]|nr:hypothetical protein [Alphaproteobacteria bacterium]